MTDRSRSIIRRAAVTVLLFLLAASLLFYLLLPVFERKKAQEIFGRDDVIVGDSFHQPWFYVTEEGNLYLTDWLGGRKKIVFPEYFNGVVVKKVVYDNDHVAVRAEEAYFPQGVRFGHCALQGSRSLRRIVFAEGQTDLSDIVLVGCDALEEIYLPKSLKILGRDILYQPENKTRLTLYYAGTEEEWLALGSAAEQAARTYPMVYGTPVPER